MIEELRMKGDQLEWNSKSYCILLTLLSFTLHSITFQLIVSIHPFFGTFSVTSFGQPLSSLIQHIGSNEH